MLCDAKYAVALRGDSVGRYVRKLAAIAHHGAKCYVCGKLFVQKDRDEAAWQFAHIEPVNDPNDKRDRWAVGWRDEPLFTRQWWDFMARTRLTCSQRCNRLAEGRNDRGLQDMGVEMIEDSSICRMRQLAMEL